MNKYHGIIGGWTNLIKENETNGSHVDFNIDETRQTKVWQYSYEALWISIIDI